MGSVISAAENGILGDETEVAADMAGEEGLSFNYMAATVMFCVQ